MGGIYNLYDSKEKTAYNRALTDVEADVKEWLSDLNKDDFICVVDVEAWFEREKLLRSTA